MKPIERLKQYQEFHEEMKLLFDKIEKAYGLISQEFLNVEIDSEAVFFNYLEYDPNDPTCGNHIEFTKEEFNIMVEDFDNSVVKIKLNIKEAEQKEREEHAKRKRLEREANELKYKTELENLAKSYGVTDIAKYEKAVEQLKTKYKKY